MDKVKAAAAGARRTASDRTTIVRVKPLAVTGARMLRALWWSMMFSDLASPAEAGFAKAGNRGPLFGIMLKNDSADRR